MNSTGVRAGLNLANNHDANDNQFSLALDALTEESWKGALFG